MPEVTNKPSVTSHQVGATVYVPYTAISGSPQTVTVESTESIVTDADNNGTGEQTDNYTFIGVPNFSLPGSKVFSTKGALETYLDNLIDQA